MNKKYFRLQGRLVNIGELIHIPRKNVPDLYKRVLTIETVDSQILFPELRNRKLRLLEREQIETNCIVEIQYSFEGSEKNNKRYNNIFIFDIKRLSI